MRAAAIPGPRDVSRAMGRFQRLTGVEWTASLHDAEVAVIFGGDGTIHRNLHELVGRKVPVLVVPCGSGNDFARALRIGSPHDAVRAFRNFERDPGSAWAIDLGVIREQSTDGRQRYFCCAAGVGIDGEIAIRSNRFPLWLRARGGYAVSAVREIFRFAPLPMSVSPNRNSAPLRPTLLAAVANCPAYGGGMKIAPRAKLDDGLLDLCVIRAMNPFRLFCLFPTVYFGRHLGFETVEYSQTDSLRVETESPLDVYADGEYVCKTPASFEVAPGALKVITPEGL
jgi:diacylglycerol kinase (ATP)